MGKLFTYVTEQYNLVFCKGWLWGCITSLAESSGTGILPVFLWLSDLQAFWLEIGISFSFGAHAECATIFNFLILIIVGVVAAIEVAGNKLNLASCKRRFKLKLHKADVLSWCQILHCCNVQCSENELPIQLSVDFGPWVLQYVQPTKY